MRLVLAILWVNLLILVSCDNSSQSFRIGVLMPQDAGQQVAFKNGIDWAFENLNAAGGHHYEAVYKSVSPANLHRAAQEFAQDPGIAAVIGPATSHDAIALAPRFVAARKPMVTPSASAGDLFLVYKNQKISRSYIWRTMESDVAQSLVMAGVARQGADQNPGFPAKIGLISSRDAQLVSLNENNQIDIGGYGDTFFDWLGFFANELKVDTTIPQRFKPPFNDAICDQLACQALGVAYPCQGRQTPPGYVWPSMIMIATSSVDDAVCAIKAVQTLKSDMSFLVGDAIAPDVLFAKLSGNVGKIRGLAPVADPANQFDAAYQKRYNVKSVPTYAANAYDAALLIGYGLQEWSRGRNGPLSEAMEAVVRGQGAAPTSWDASGVKTAVEAIKAGQKIWVGGAASPLRFDRDFGVDLTSSQYALWKYENNQVVIQEVLSAARSTARGNLELSIANQPVNVGQISDLEVCPDQADPPSASQKTWALLLASSFGFQNYRHQADILAQYNLLIENGVPKEQIVLIYADDIANNPKNPYAGKIFNVKNGPNLYSPNLNSYRLCGSTPSCTNGVGAIEIMQILSGTPLKAKCLREPCAIRSSSGDNVYVSFVGHGSASGLAVNFNEEVDSTGPRIKGASELTPVLLAQTLRAMQNTKPDQNVLIVNDMCHAGALADALVRSNIPNVIMLAATRPNENGFALDWDPQIGTYLNDQFSSALVSNLLRISMPTIAGIYQATYVQTPGSHVTLYNAKNFSGTLCAPFDEFISQP